MNADRLLEVYEQISEAPDAIARLRRFVLDLAVRGKLVEQDAEDEPAARLAQRIEKRKAEILKKTDMRKPRKVSDMDPAEIWADLPANWTWTQISNLGFISPRNEADDDVKASFVPMPMIFAEYGVANDHEVRPWKEIKKGYTHFAEGDVGLAKITPCFENGKSTVFRNLTGGFGSGTTELHILRPILVDPDYVVLFLKSPQFIETGIPKMTGTAGQKRVSSEYFTSSPFPLPPLAEQHRIVAKVDELMALCDRLEEARKTREEVRDKLTAASLARLTALDTTPEDFPNHAAFVLEALPALTMRPDQIKTLRQTILNLAVRGKLVEQDPADDRSNQAVLRPDSEAENYDGRAFDERAALFKLPDGWSIQPLSRVSDRIVDCPHTTPKWTNEGVLCIKTNQVRAGILDLTSPNFVSEETYKIRIERLIPKPEDILYIREGGILGVGCRIPNGVRLCMGQRLMLIRANASIATVFLELCLNSPWIADFAAEKTTGGAAPRVNMALVRGYPIPLPPLAEQHRIVAKVDALMTLCDQLEAALTTADTTRTRLLEALLHEALEPNAPIQEAAE
jgi:type I restriction enzyme S subunit